MIPTAGAVRAPGAEPAGRELKRPLLGAAINTSAMRRRGPFRGCTSFPDCAISPQGVGPFPGVAAMTKVTFQVLEGIDKGRVFRDLTTPVTIGREEGNLLRLNDERVSRFHAK